MGEETWQALPRPIRRVKTLNLGAGNRIVRKATNHDVWRHRDEIDIVWDLNELPWPWQDNDFDKVISWAVFEHLDITLLTAMNECWRILRPNGIAKVKLPYWKSEMSYNDPTHRYVVGLGIFDIFDPTTQKGRKHSFYTDKKWHIEEVGLSHSESSVWGKLRAIK